MLNPLELGALLGVALLVFGPKKIPEIANSLGKSITEFKKGAREVENSIRKELEAETPVIPVVPLAIAQAAVPTLPAPLAPEPQAHPAENP
jgi:TatA/E family protein of Tat protein translocase